METLVKIGSTGPGQLVLSDSCTDNGIFWNVLTLPDWELRYNYAPPSNYVAGNCLLSVVEDSGAVAVSAVLRAPTMAGIEVHKITLANALKAWPGEFSVTSIEPGYSNPDVTTLIHGPWQSFPTLPKWGELNVSLLKLHALEVTFSLPVNP